MVVPTFTDVVVVTQLLLTFTDLSLLFLLLLTFTDGVVVTVV